MSENTGTVFNLQRFSTNDGPGIRTVVFLKGCPLDCLWCHNPESKSFVPELSFDEMRCISCGYCAGACENKCHSITEGRHRFTRNGCRNCGKCADGCPGDALTLFGKEMSVSEVIRTVMSDRSYYSVSGGGLTVSGGEPLAQPIFTADLLQTAKGYGIHTAIETSGFSEWKNIERILPHTDLWLFDVKETDRGLHKKYTGVYPEKIQRNLKRIDEYGSNIILRCPIIPAYNDRSEHLKNIGKLAESLKHVNAVEIEPYHSLGAGKARNIGREYIVDIQGPVEREVIDRWIEEIRKETNVTVRQG